MKTAKITASYAIAGKIAIQFDIDITDHQAREILDAIGAVFTDKWSDGSVTRVEKDKLSLTRKAKEDSLDQMDVLKDTLVSAQYEVVETPMLEGKEQLALPEPTPENPDAVEDDFSFEPETGGDL